MSDYIKVAKASEVAPGSAKTVEAAGQKIALYNVSGKIYATTNACAHRGGPLGEGDLDGTCVTCPWHGWSFDVTTGTATHQAASVKTFPVKVEGDDILIQL